MLFCRYRGGGHVKRVGGRRGDSLRAKIKGYSFFRKSVLGVGGGELSSVILLFHPVLLTCVDPHMQSFRFLYIFLISFETDHTAVDSGHGHISR